MILKLYWNWEKLDETTYRAKVIGGWLVKTHASAEGKSGWAISETVTFLQDSEHRWVILQPPKPEEKKPSVAQDF